MRIKSIRLENWYICNPNVKTIDAYIAPELISHHLYGQVYNHSSYIDGDFILTSSIISVNKNHVITANGTIYELGKPNIEYVKWCKKQGCHTPTIVEPIRYV